MDIDDAFTKAALYETCSKSKVLRNIDLNDVDTQTLRRLVNKYNTLSVREFPVIVSKALIKLGMTFLVEKLPRLRAYISPENISVRVEADEQAYFESTETSFQPNIYLIVAKNIAINVLGTSIQSLKQVIADSVDGGKPNGAGGDSGGGGADTGVQRGRIKVSSVYRPVQTFDAPRRFTNFGDTFKTTTTTKAVDEEGHAARATRRVVAVDGLRDKLRDITNDKRRRRRDSVVSKQRRCYKEILREEDDGSIDRRDDDRVNATVDDVDVSLDTTATTTTTTMNDDDEANRLVKGTRDAATTAEGDADATLPAGPTVAVDEHVRGRLNAAAIVERFLELNNVDRQQQSPPPLTTRPTHTETYPADNAIISGDEETVDDPFGAINADRFMTMIESHYTDSKTADNHGIVNSGEKRVSDDGQHNDVANERRPLDPTVENTLMFDDDDDDYGFDDMNVDDDDDAGSEKAAVIKNVTRVISPVQVHT